MEHEGSPESKARPTYDQVQPDDSYEDLTQCKQQQKKLLSVQQHMNNWRYEI